MIRVLITGEFEEAWARVAAGLVSQDRREYEKGLENGTLALQAPRLPRVRACFAASGLDAAREFVRANPQVVLSLGRPPQGLLELNLSDRVKWRHLECPPAPAELKPLIYQTYLGQALFPHPALKARPLVSVFTPTFNAAAHLTAAYASLKAQTWDNWEWVLIDDGSKDAAPELVSAWAASDPRIRFFQHGRGNLGNIGRIKRYATGLALGEFLVELDHDDLLTPTALAEVAAAFLAEPEVGFVYTNFAEFLEDGRNHYYPEWMRRGRYRHTRRQGRTYLEALAYDVYGDVDGIGPVIKDMTICPNHIRAFRRTALAACGSYNPELVMGDDYDLMIRLFLSTRFKHLDRLLYLYRVHDNTWARYNEYARFIFPVITQRYEAQIDARVKALRDQGLWLDEPQGRPRRGSGGASRPGSRS